MRRYLRRRNDRNCVTTNYDARVCVCVRVFSGRQLRPGALGDAVGNWIRLDLCNWPHGISIRPGPTLGAYRRFKFVNAAVGRLSLE